MLLLLTYISEEEYKKQNILLHKYSNKIIN